MQVASNHPSDKKTVLDRQVQANERSSSPSSKNLSVKVEDTVLAKGAERNETSQYLKVLSRIENLLIQDKLPDAAIDGFVGAIKKQIDLMSEADIQMVLKLPEAEKIELKSLENLPEMITNNLRDENKSPALLKFLRQSNFAILMRTDSNTTPKTYTPQSAQVHNSSKLPVSKTADGTLKKVNPPLAATPETVQKTNFNKNPPVSSPIS